MKNTKKLLALLFALVMLFAFCACSSADDKDDDKKEDGSQVIQDGEETDGAQDGEDTDGAQDGEETGYVGTWKVIPPDSNSFPPLYLVLNEDGTAGYGAKLESLEPHLWYESDADDAVDNQMELSREDNVGYGKVFYLTEDGRIYMEINLSVGDRSYDHIYFERM